MENFIETKPFIRVWKWEDAPKEFQSLFSPNDADWLALAPAEMAVEMIPWIELGDGFGRCDVNKCKLEGGDVVYVGYHA